jgi:acetoacetate decarboxylase
MFTFIKKLREQQVASAGNLWDNARFLMADVPLSPAAAELLPLGMKPASPAVGTIFIADYTKTNFTVPYREAALLVHVRTPLGKGVHCPWMLVDDDTALIYGRELLGYPKKLASIEFSENGKDVKASVTRRGITMLSMKGEIGRPHDQKPPVFDCKTFNAGGLSQTYLLNAIWLFRVRERVRESNEASVSVETSPSAFDPIDRYIAGPPIAGRFAVTDILGSKYMFPVGMAGPAWLSRVYMLRFR